MCRYRACLCAQACPVKDEFERKARDYVTELPWVKQARANHSAKRANSDATAICHVHADALFTRR
jgi:hypothetical protein